MCIFQIMNNTKNKTLQELSLKQFAKRLVALMPRLTRGMITQERSYFTRGVITLPQLWALQIVAEMDACSMRDLAQALALKSSTVTGLVDRLVKLGLVRRYNSQEDRRVVLAAITPKGRKILNHLQEENHEATIRLFKNITAQERAIYLDILEKIVNKLSSQKERPRRK